LNRLAHLADPEPVVDLESSLVSGLPASDFESTVGAHTLACYQEMKLDVVAEDLVGKLVLANVVVLQMHIARCIAAAKLPESTGIAAG
jgi:hypothetical protein